MSATRSRQAAARIRILATLDSSGPHLLPMLFGELGRVLAFDSAAWYHLDEQGHPRMLTEDPDVLTVIPTYLDQKMQAAERKVARPFAVARREDFGPQLRSQLITVPYARFLRSDYYNVLLRPIQIHDCVSLVTRLPDGRATGALKFYRRTRGTDFRREELDTLARLEPFLATALQPRVPATTDPGETHDRALFIVTPAGELLWLSAQAGTLAARAFGAQWRRAGELPAPLRSVLARLRQLHRPAAGQDTGIPLPRLQWRDPRGGFVVEARWLGAAHGAADAVALELEQRVPRRHGMLKRLSALQLPPRQFEIACHLTGAHSEARIAESLGITRNTMVYHRRRLYERLGVHSRRELLDRLAQPGPAHQP